MSTAEEKKQKQLDKLAAKLEKKAQYLPKGQRVLMFFVSFAILIFMIVTAIRVGTKVAKANLNSPDFTTVDMSSFKGLAILVILLAVVQVLLFAAHIVLPIVRKKRVKIFGCIVAALIAAVSVFYPTSLAIVALGGNNWQYRLSSDPTSTLSTIKTKTNYYDEDNEAKAAYLVSFIEANATKTSSGSVKGVSHDVEHYYSSDSNYTYAHTLSKHPHVAYERRVTGDSNYSDEIWDFYIPDGNFAELISTNSMWDLDLSDWDEDDKNDEQTYFVTYGGSVEQYDNCGYSEIVPAFDAYGAIYCKDSSGNLAVYCYYLVDNTNHALRLVICHY
jgi:hypothetical protein